MVWVITLGELTDAFVLQTDPNTTNNVVLELCWSWQSSTCIYFEFDSHQNSADPSTDHFQLIKPKSGFGNNIKIL